MKLWIVYRLYREINHQSVLSTLVFAQVRENLLRDNHVQVLAEMISLCHRDNISVGNHLSLVFGEPGQCLELGGLLIVEKMYRLIHQFNPLLGNNRLDYIAPFFASLNSELFSP
jgi:hypothetical protein